MLIFNGQRRNKYYLGVLVALVHALITLTLCDDLPSVLNNDLVGFERTVGSYPVATVSCLHDLDANVVFAPCFAPLL